MSSNRGGLLSRVFVQWGGEGMGREENTGPGEVLSGIGTNIDYDFDLPKRRNAMFVRRVMAEKRSSKNNIRVCRDMTAVS